MAVGSLATLIGFLIVGGVVLMTAFNKVSKQKKKIINSL